MKKTSQYNQNGFQNLFIWFLIIMIYVSFINIFVFKTTPEIIFFQFLAISIIFLKTRLKEYALDWIPFIALFFLYEFIRGFIDNLSPFKSFTLEWIYKLENFIFGYLPTSFLQDKLGANRTIVNVSLFFYTLFFYFSFLVAFILWVKERKVFREYSKKFLLLSYLGMIFFFLIPTAPPWLIEKSLHLGITRIIYENTILKNFIVVTVWNYFIHGNEVAAFPSLHSAWPMFTSLFLIKKFKKNIFWLSLIIPFMIGFSVVLSGEHFVLDVLFGYLLAYLVLTYTFNDKGENAPKDNK